MRTLQAAVIAGALALPLAASTEAQGPIVIGNGGLVNVQIGTIDVIDNVEVVVRDIDVNVNAAVQIAANVCGVAVGVIADDLVDGSAYCQTAEQVADFVRITR